MSTAVFKTLVVAAVASVALTTQATACYWVGGRTAYVTINIGGLEEVACVVPIERNAIKGWSRLHLGKPAYPGSDAYLCKRADGSLLTGSITLDITRSGCILLSVAGGTYLVDPAVSNASGYAEHSSGSFRGYYNDFAIVMDISPWRGARPE